MNDSLLTPSTRYAEGVAAHRWEADPPQLAVLPFFDHLQQALTTPTGNNNHRWLGRLKSLFGNEPKPVVKGLYLWGSVGRGKTFLMDLFVASLPHGMALRRHFHDFMGEVHAQLRSLGEHQNPLEDVATELAGRCRVLCLDEFLVNDIGNAMILSGLLEGLMARGVCLVTTSNTKPANLYQNGLQRARFLPAIALLEQSCRVLEMVSPHDWRLRSLAQAAVYLHPPGAEAEHMLERIFANHAEGEIQHGGELIVNDRAIPYQRRAGNILWFEFAALCEGPRGVADYIALARQYPTVILTNVPQFSIYTEDAAHRLILLVDEFYDRKVKLVISAASAITDLYDGTRLRAEFGRTESRLIEMQSEDYLASEWLPER